jgi:transposase-like protein
VRGVDDEEIAPPTWEWATQEDPIQERTLQQLLVGVSTRGYAKSLEPAPPGIEESLSVSRSAVSRRFVARTQAQVQEFLCRPLEDLDVPVVMIDGTWLGDHLLLVALGIDATGQKHVLGVREGSTENEGVCRSLLSELVERGLANRVQLTTDGHRVYLDAVEAHSARPWTTRCWSSSTAKARSWRSATARRRA